MGYGRGNWPGRGPFSSLPPWERPGRLYGRGACYYLYGIPPTAPIIAPANEVDTLTHQKNSIEAQIANMQVALTSIQKRLDELKK